MAKKKKMSNFTVKQLREAARLAGEKLTRRSNRYVITENVAKHLDCPYKMVADKDGK